MHIDEDGCLAPFIGLLFVLFVIALSIGIVILITWFVCYCFNMPFNPWYGVGVWVILFLLKIILN